MKPAQGLMIGPAGFMSRRRREAGLSGGGFIAEVIAMRAVVRLTADDAFKNQPMGRWVDQVLGGGYGRYCAGEPWVPAINLYEGAEQYCVVVDLAGVHAAEIDVHVEGRRLIVSGSRVTPTPCDAAGRVCVYLMEIDHGNFCRQVGLPEDADVSDVDVIKATYQGGFLWVRIPRKG